MIVFSLAWPARIVMVLLQIILCSIYNAVLYFKTWCFTHKENLSSEVKQWCNCCLIDIVSYWAFILSFISYLLFQSSQSDQFIPRWTTHVVVCMYMFCLFFAIVLRCCICCCFCCLSDLRWLWWQALRRKLAGFRLDESSLNLAPACGSLTGF